MKKSEDGQTLVLSMLLLPVVAIGIIAGLSIVTGQIQERSRAQTAADAAALAGAAAGESAASQAASANGADLVSVTHEAGSTLVVVRLGHTQAKARARVGQISDTISKSTKDPGL